MLFVILLLGAALSTSAQSTPSEILEKSKQAYTGLKAIAMEANREETVTAGPIRTEAVSQYTYAVRGNLKLHLARKSDGEQSVLISDGSSTWRALGHKKEWARIEVATSPAADAPKLSSKSKEPTLTQDVMSALLGRGLSFVRRAGQAEMGKDESLKLDGRKVECWVLRAVLDDFQEEAWIDKQSYLVAYHRRKGRVNFDGRAGILESKVRLKSLRLDDAVPDSLFAFAPPSGWKQVDLIVLPGEENLRLENMPAANFTLKDLKGEPVELASLKGKVVVLDFWATWCPPCVKSLPALEKLSARYRDKGLVVVGVSKEESGTIRSFLKDKGFHFTFLQDGKDEVHNRYAISAFPTTFIIDRDGVIRVHQVGYGGEEKLVADVAKLLN